MYMYDPFYFGYQINGGYRLNPHERRRFDIRRGQLSEEHEYELFRRCIFIAADGSIIDDGDDVYLLDVPVQDRVMKIDYLHGLIHGVPSANLYADDEGALAISMVQLGWWGNTVKRITVLQRKWRKWLNRQWRLYVQPDLIQLAKQMLKVIEESRKLGWMVPSLDYERKLAERDYSWASTRQRLAELHHLQRRYWETRIQQEQEADMSAATEDQALLCATYGCTCHCCIVW